MLFENSKWETIPSGFSRDMSNITFSCLTQIVNKIKNTSNSKVQTPSLLSEYPVNLTQKIVSGGR